jgi:hypothetical protein
VGCYPFALGIRISEENTREREMICYTRKSIFIERQRGTNIWPDSKTKRLIDEIQRTEEENDMV